MKIDVRRAAEPDLDFIAALEKENFSISEKREDFEKMLDSVDKVLLVATLDGERVGYVAAYTVARESDILTIAVEPRFRGSGVGRALILALFDALSGESDAVFLEVRKSNEAARKLYASSGFCEIGSRKNYYKLPTEDAILYKKDL